MPIVNLSRNTRYMRKSLCSHNRFIWWKGEVLSHPCHYQMADMLNTFSSRLLWLFKECFNYFSSSPTVLLLPLSHLSLCLSGTITTRSPSNLLQSIDHCYDMFCLKSQIAIFLWARKNHSLPKFIVVMASCFRAWKVLLSCGTYY